MAYTLQAILGRADTLYGASLQGTQLVEMLAGVSMLPLGRAFLEAYGVPFLPLTDAGEASLPPAIQMVCAQLAERGEVAYVEAEFSGGEGIQASVLFHRGGAHDPPRLASDAINVALKALGVSPYADIDEFSTVGLGEHRDTEAWLSSAGP